MISDDVITRYFEWLLELIDYEEPDLKTVSYRKLLRNLFDTEFTYLISNDSNRAEDGVDLRYRYSIETGDDEILYFDEPCSVLEMLIGLAVRCEEHIMSDPDVGDRTSEWFWIMIDNLGLKSMIDDKYDTTVVDKKVETFLNREYAPDGKGGLFIVKNSDYDLREVEIWFQMCWFLDSIL